MEPLILIHTNSWLVIRLQIIGDRNVRQATFVERVILLVWLEVRSVEVLNIHKAGLSLRVSVNIIINWRFAVQNRVIATLSVRILLWIKQVRRSAVCPTFQVSIFFNSALQHRVWNQFLGRILHQIGMLFIVLLWLCLNILWPERFWRLNIADVDCFLFHFFITWLSL